MDNDIAANMLPNFLIIGAAKSGTTSLAKYLSEHSDVYVVKGSEFKEPCYFAPAEAGGVTSWSEYVGLFRPGVDCSLRGEKSVAYLYHQDSASQIRSALGSDVKLVVVLRNPVHMAYSLWGHNVRLGVERLSFDKALRVEESRKHDRNFRQGFHGWADTCFYTEWARYGVQLERYFSIFPAENIKVLVYEEFFVPGLPQYPELLEFLGVGFERAPTQKRHNPAGSVRSKWLRAALGEMFWWKKPVRWILPKSIRARLWALLDKANRTEKPLSPLEATMVERLEAEFHDDVRNLEKIIGRDLSRVWF